MAGIKRRSWFLTGIILFLLIIVVLGLGNIPADSPMAEKNYPVKGVELAPHGTQGNKLSLVGAKNEYLSLYFRIKKADLATFKVNGAGKIPDNHLSFQFYQVVSAPKNSKFQADALVPLELKLGDSGQQLDIWMTVKIAASATKGLHNFEVVFTDKNGSYRQPVELKVWNFGLPDDLPITVMAQLYLSRQWFGRYGITSLKQLDQVLREYFRSMRDYKINATVQVYALSIQRVTAGEKVEDLPGYHRMLQYVLNDLGYRHFCVPLFAARFLLKPGNDFKEKAKIFYPAFAEYLRRHSWEKRAMIYSWDEPTPSEHQAFIKAYDYLKKLAPAFQTLTAGTAPEPDTAKVVDVWVTYAGVYNSQKVEEARSLGQQEWLYANKLHGIDQPLTHQRILGWLLFNYKFTGYLFWGMNCWPEDPWSKEAGRHDAWRRGTFYYPNPYTGEPLPTTRLEAMRQGLQDYQYLILLQQAHEKGLVDPNKFEAIGARVKVFTRDINALKPPVTMSDLDNLRQEIGETLNLVYTK